MRKFAAVERQTSTNCSPGAIRLKSPGSLVTIA
jgi:hypothetical protein